MPFRAEAHHEIVINGAAYEIAEHPAAPGMPYGQEGRQAVVYRIFLKGAAEKGNGTSFALKVFKPHFRLPSLVSLTERLGRYASIPGLSVCKRTVITPRNNADLLAVHPDLIYSVVMPWLDGPTWMEVMLDGKALTREMSLHLARSFADQLSYMEEYGTAHCDISGPNLLIPALADPPSQEGPPVALVDVEQLYGPSLERPEALPGGSPGYAHRTAPEGLWSAAADRFSGALLLAEMLGLCDRRALDASWGENYFDPGEVQKPGSARFDTLQKVLQENWGAAVGELLRRAWCSESLTECPTLGEWLMALQKQESVKPGTVKGAETADLPAASRMPQAQAGPPVQEAKARPAESPEPSESSLYASPVAATQTAAPTQAPAPPEVRTPSPSQASPAVQATTAQQVKTCAKCRTSISADMQFCPNCGTPASSPVQDATASPQQVKTCTKCRTSIPADMQFCSNCGTPSASPEQSGSPSAPERLQLSSAPSTLHGASAQTSGAAAQKSVQPHAENREAGASNNAALHGKRIMQIVGSIIGAALLILLAGGWGVLAVIAVICLMNLRAAFKKYNKSMQQSSQPPAPEESSSSGENRQAIPSKKTGLSGGWKIAIAAALLFILVFIAKTVICYDLADNYEKKGRELMSSGKSDEALEQFNKAISLKPDSYGYNLRAKAYCERGDYQNALADYTRAGSYADTFGRGIAYYRTGDYDKAIADFSKAIESDDGSCYGHSFGKKADDNPEKYLFRGKAYCEKGDFEKALADFKMEKPRRSEVNYVDYVGPDDSAGNFAFTQKIESYDRAIGSYPESAAGYYGRGLAYYEHLDYDKALSDLKKAESMGYKVNWSFFTNLKK